MKKATRAARLVLVGGLMLSSVLGSGCQSMSNTDKGVLTGGALGATAGGLIGSTKGKAGLGAVAGGVVGAIAGGLTGAAIDNSEKKKAEMVAAANAPPPLSLEDVINLSRNGTSDEIIISQIFNTGSVYRLTADQILYLQNNGVRDRVIQAMQQTAYRPVRRVYTAVPVEAPVYVVPPPPPPPPVGFGVGFAIRGR
jgi:hypothetical protein